MRLSVVFLAAALLATGGSTARADDGGGVTVGVVRLRAVFSAYKKSEVLRADLELFRDERQKRIDALEDEIVALREEIEASDMLSEDAVSEKKDELSAMLDEHAEFIQRAQDELSDKENEIIAEVGQDIRSAVGSYAKIQNLDIIVDSSAVVAYDESLDITEDIIAQMNAAYKPRGGAAPPAAPAPPAEGAAPSETELEAPPAGGLGE